MIVRLTYLLSLVGGLAALTPGQRR